MAEMLQRLFSEGRIRRPQIRYQPFQGFDGPVQGMRGSMPANALDTQAMNDVAQGIDIGSVAPTRLSAGDIQAASYAQPGGDAEDGGGGGVPVRAVSAVATEDCPGGQCPNRSMPMMQGESLPSYFTPPPGYVPGSYRELPATASAPTATAALQATAQPGAATAAPQASMAPQGQQQGSGEQTPFYEDPAYFFGQTNTHLADARSAAQMSRAVEANFSFRMAMQSYQAGIMAAATRNQVKIAEMTRALGNRAMTLQEQRFQAETGQLTPTIIAERRSDRRMSVEQRALDVIRMKYSDLPPEMRPTNPDKMEEELRLEMATIAAGDMASHMQTIGQVGEKLAAATASGASQDVTDALDLQFADAETQLEFAMRSRLKSEPPEMWETALRNELYPAYKSAFADSAKAAGRPIDDGSAERSALRAIQVHINNLPRIMAPDNEYVSPIQRFMSRVNAKPQPAPAAQEPTPQSDTDLQAPAAGISTSGSGPGQMTVGPTGTMSLAR